MSHTPSLILGTGWRWDDPAHQRGLVTLPIRELMHTHCIGKSNYGKSRWLASLFLMLLSRGVSATLIDPTGDLSRLVLQQLIATGYFARPDAFDQLVYLDIPSALQQGRYLPFNVLNTGHDPYAASDMVLEAFRRLWPALKDGTSTTIESLVKMSSFVLASHQLPLLPFMYQLLTDTPWREYLLRGVNDTLVVQFFQRYSLLQRKGQMQLIEPTLKRINLLAFSPVLRYSLGQSDNNVLNFRTVLDTNRSVIINLNLPDLTAQRLLGCLLTVSAEYGAKARGAIPAEQRTGTHMLILDEFQNFTAQSEEAMNTILDECRKYQLFLCLAHQNWGQIPPSLRGALNSCGIEVVFKLERSDAEQSAPLVGFQFDPYLVKYRVPNPLRRLDSAPQFYSVAEQHELHIEAIAQLAKREAFVRLPDSRLYKMRSLTVDDPVIDRTLLRAIEERYLSTFFRPQAEIEVAIARQMWQAPPEPMSPPKSAALASTQPTPKRQPRKTQSKQPDTPATIDRVAEHTDKPIRDDDDDLLRD
jgi:hypothetical protein